MEINRQNAISDNVGNNLGNNVVSVRFMQKLCARDQLFIQPLCYLAENIKQLLLKKNNCTYDINKIDTNLVLDDVIGNSVGNSLDTCMFFTKSNNIIKLEFEKYTKNDITEKNEFTYGLDKLYSNFNFKYNNVNFNIKSMNDINKNPIPAPMREEHTILTAYEISFDNTNIEIFETFLNASKLYFDKYIINNETDQNKLSIYMNSDEGGYFEFICDKRKRSLTNIYLPKKLKNDMIADLTRFLQPETKARYEQLGINYKRIYLFEGVPGAGKTSFILALASRFNYNIAIINFGPKFKDSDLLKTLSNLHDLGPKDRKTFLILEDMDCIFKERKSNDEARNMVSFSGLLNALDGITTQENLICFITTNYKQNLDSALIRPGRVDYILRFDYIVKEQVYEMFKIYMSLTDSIEDNILTDEFYKELNTLNIKITTSLVQQYLFKYLDKPQDAIDNISELKKMHQNSTTNIEAEDTGLFG